MVLLFLAQLAQLARADTADTADTAGPGDTADTSSGRDTDPYVDTAAKAESVYVQDVGCGGSAASFGFVGLLGAVGLFGGKRRA
jgi:hypothetical protein